MPSRPYLAAGSNASRRGEATDRLWPARGACRGASRSRRTTCATGTTPISTARSAFPIWRSSVVSRTISSSLRMRQPSPLPIEPGEALLQSREARTRGRARRVWLLRCDRLLAPRPRRHPRHRAHIHGAPCRHESRCHRQCACIVVQGDGIWQRRFMADPMCAPRGSCSTSACRVATSCARRSRTSRRCRQRAVPREQQRGARIRHARTPPSRASALLGDLPLLRARDERGKRLQPLEWHRGYAVACGRDAGRHRPMDLRRRI